VKSGKIFSPLVELAAAGPPDGLDDGEAAAIATAEQLACECVNDERKAIRIARSRRIDVRPDANLSTLSCRLRPAVIEMANHDLCAQR